MVPTAIKYLDALHVLLLESEITFVQFRFVPRKSFRFLDGFIIISTFEEVRGKSHPNFFEHQCGKFDVFPEH